MHNKHDDLRLVLAAIPTDGLRCCLDALNRDDVVRGRFVDADGRGCLVHYFSRRQVVDRRSRINWMKDNAFFGDEQNAAIKRLIVGWDAVTPDCIVKGPEYHSEYPPVAYTLYSHDVRLAIEAMLAQREAANQQEEAARQFAVR